MFRLGAVSQKRLDEFAAKQQCRRNSLHSPLYYPDIEETLDDRRARDGDVRDWNCCRPRKSPVEVDVC